MLALETAPQLANPWPGKLVASSAKPLEKRQRLLLLWRAQPLLYMSLQPLLRAQMYLSQHLTVLLLLL